MPSPVRWNGVVRYLVRSLAVTIAFGAGTAGAHPPDIDGAWSPVETWPASATHAHLLPSGKVLFWSEYMAAEPEYAWDPATGAVGPVAALGYNAFCAGHAFLGDGSLLVAGGHADAPWPNTGLAFASTYDPAARTWKHLPDMNMGRWYPTVATLEDGGAVVSGGWLHEGDVDEIPQVWEPGATAWRDLSTARRVQDLYARMLLAPDGRMFEAGPDSLARLLDTAGTGMWLPVARTNAGVTRTYGSAVMYRPGQVLLVGGGDPPLDSAELIDLLADAPRWTPTTSMAYARRQLDATLLPDGRVLVTGGSSGPGLDDGTHPVLPAEVWDPDTGAWTTLAAQAQYRGYHSTALLLPDGRVLSAGGRLPGTSTPQTTAEIYSPPYLFHGPRPAIASAPAGIAPGASFHVSTPDAARVAKVTLLRLASVTHAFDMNQRFLSLPFQARGDGLDATPPASSAVAPPGDWLLFLVDAAGVPSIGRVVRLAARAPGLERLVALSDVWSYDDSGVDRGTAWRSPGYDASAWKTGAGRLGFGVEGVTTALAASPVPATYYFRRTFRLDARVTAAAISVLHSDGAAVWVNGVQVYARDVGDLSHLAPALDNAPERLHRQDVALAPSPFRVGENVVAAVLKPRGLDTNGAAFALELRAGAGDGSTAHRASSGCASGAGGGLAALGVVAALALRRRSPRVPTPAA